MSAVSPLDRDPPRTPTHVATLIRKTDEYSHRLCSRNEYARLGCDSGVLASYTSEAALSKFDLDQAVRAYCRAEGITP